MVQDPDIRLLTSPRIFLVGMAAFLALVCFVVLILYQQIALAFSANPGLNGLILGVLAIGALFTFRQVIRLFREIHWVNSLTGAVTDGAPPAPILLAPMAVMLNAGAGARGLSTITTRAILDSIATRLDEGRELSRYLVGLLVFLGLLGTFWGLLETVHSISGVIESMKTGVDIDHVRRPQAGPVCANRRHERLVHLFAIRPREFLGSGFLDLQAGQRRIGSIPNSRSFSPATFRRRRLPRRFRTRRSSPKARNRRLSISVTRRRSQRLPRAFRLWSATCAPNSSKFAIGSTRRRRSRKILANSCGACWTSWARDEAGI